MYEAIKRLRELLTERGIKYKAPYASDDTYWNVNGIRWHAFESGVNTIWITCNSDVDFTPEQVIAITLGEERSCASCPEMDNPDSYIFHLIRALEHEKDECKNVAEPPSDGGFWPAPHFECSKCGHKHVSMSYVYYCPNCGAKVVDE